VIKNSKALKATSRKHAFQRHGNILFAKHAALQIYGRYPNVIGVGIGTKFRGHGKRRQKIKPVAGVKCIQFFVERKTKSVQKRRKLPKFVFARSKDGSISYGIRIPTDVIEVGAIERACGAGCQLDSNTEHGLMSLIFTNKADDARSFFLLSCAHVAGDIGRTPPAFPDLTSDCSPANPFAETITNSTEANGEVSYDIALARIDDAALPLEELTIKNHTARIDRFFPSGSIQQGMWVDAELRSNEPRGSVDSLDASADIQYGSKLLTVHNLFGVNVRAAKGDSGGLVYQNSQAVGIVVATSPRGWLWFQPIESAFEYLQSISPIPIKVFPS
jgi:hypothetical protein